MRIIFILAVLLLSLHLNAMATGIQPVGRDPFDISFKVESIDPMNSGAAVSIQGEGLHRTFKVHITHGNPIFIASETQKVIPNNKDLKVSSSDFAVSPCDENFATLNHEKEKVIFKLERRDCRDPQAPSNNWFFPNVKVAKLFAVVMGLHSSILWHEDVKELLAKEFSQDEIDRTIDFAITGEKGKLEIAQSGTIKIGNDEVKIRGRYVLERDTGGLGPIRAAPVSKSYLSLVNRTFSKKCSSIKAGDSRSDIQCAMFASKNIKNDFEAYISEGWKKEGAESQLSKFRNYLDESGRTILMAFSSVGCGRNSTRIEEGERTRLQEQRKKIYSSLIKMGLKVDQRDRIGRTALFYALHFGCDPEAEQLLKAGASTAIADFNEVPILDYALNGKLENYYRRLVNDTPMAFLERKPDSKPFTGEYRQERTIGGLKILEPKSALISALDAGSVTAYTLLLAKKPKLTEALEGEIVSKAIYSNNPELVIASIQGGLNFRKIKIWGSERFPANEAIVKMGGLSTKKRNELLALLRPIAKDNEPQIIEACGKNPTIFEHCLRENGVCEKLTSSVQREGCYLSKGECSRIKDSKLNWQCLKANAFASGSAGFDFSRFCDGAKKDPLEYDICRFSSLSSEKMIEAFKKIVSDRRGAGYLTHFFSYESKFFLGRINAKEIQELTNLCVSSPRLLTDHDAGRVRKCVSMAVAADSSGAVAAEMVKKAIQCEKEGSAESCLGPAVFSFEGNDREAAAGSATVARLCEAGSGVACYLALVRKSILPELSSNAAFLGCETITEGFACTSFHGNLWGGAGLSAKLPELKKLALRGELRSIEFITMAQGYGDFTAEELEKVERVLWPKCFEEAQGCRALNLLLRRIGKSEKILRFREAILGLADDQCGKKHNCLSVKDFASENPKLAEKLNGFCRDRVPSACGGFQGAVDDPNKRKISENDVISCFEKDAKDKDHTCSHLASLHLSANHNSGIPPSDNVCDWFTGYPCLNNLHQIVDDLPYKPERISELKIKCENKSALGACMILGKYYERFSPENAIPAFDRACAEGRGRPGFQEEPCVASVRILRKLKRKTEIEKLNASACKDPGSQVCREIMLARLQLSPSTLAQSFREDCLSGNRMKCDPYVRYLTEADPKGVRLFQQELCQKHKIYCVQ